MGWEAVSDMIKKCTKHKLCTWQHYWLCLGPCSIITVVTVDKQKVFSIVENNQGRQKIPSFNPTCHTVDLEHHLV